jgi:hypothetical protein
VDVELPRKPRQVTVDPDQVLLDCVPTNNHWKAECNYRWTPVYTQLEETDLTTDYDKWNFICGPWVYGASYSDPWYTRSPMIGVRAGAYRLQTFSGGVYGAFRSDYRDLAVGADGLWDHCCLPQTQVGFNAEQSLFSVFASDHTPSSRATFFVRHVLQYGSSLYLPPIQYVEAFTTMQNHALPEPQETVPGGIYLSDSAMGGVHYHLNYLTPYWDPEGGFRLDVTYGAGVPFSGPSQLFHRADAQLSWVKSLPEWTGPLSRTRWAGRLLGGGGVPDRFMLFTLGGANRFRGYSMDQCLGSAVWVASIEWRLPLVQRVNWDCCDHLAGIRNISLAPFYDVGQCYLNGKNVGVATPHALGVGLRVDVAWVSIVERTTLRLDVAKTINDDTSVQVWFGVSHPF